MSCALAVSGVDQRHGQARQRNAARRRRRYLHSARVAHKVTNKAIEVIGQTSLGLLDGLSLGGFSYLTGAEVVCPPAYNVGLYGSMVPFPVTGGAKRAAAEGGDLLDACRARQWGENPDVLRLSALVAS
ncbi:hypothetical protein [Streptomyces sp. NPDC007991]|uniref:hypothetical protein n=1 Tax=Streptomyces sp. NPDC007991 TaxID=3364803 RepID=UPI0036E9BF6D